MRIVELYFSLVIVTILKRAKQKEIVYTALEILAEPISA